MKFKSTASNINYAQILIVNYPCNATDTNCKPNIICHTKNGHYRFTVLQLLSLAK